MEEKTEELLRKIKSRTKEGSVNWTSGSSDTQYKLKLPSGTVLVDRYKKPTNEPPKPNIVKGYKVSILNNDGDEIDSVASREDERGEMYDFLEEMWSLAKRDYKNVDKVLGKMLKEVESEGEIGEDAEETFEPDDDLPF
jgi:hypothetical protein